MGFGGLGDLCLLSFSCTFINDIFGSNVLRLLGLRIDQSKFEVKVVMSQLGINFKSDNLTLS